MQIKNVNWFYFNIRQIFTLLSVSFSLGVYAHLFIYFLNFDIFYGVILTTRMENKTIFDLSNFDQWKQRFSYPWWNNMFHFFCLKMHCIFLIYFQFYTRHRFFVWVFNFATWAALLRLRLLITVTLVTWLTTYLDILLYLNWMWSLI